MAPMKATMEDEVALDENALAGLQSSMSGELIGPQDEEYEQCRRVYNGMIDKYPRLIARCADVADVIAVVNFARDNNLLLAVRGGGHNGAGLGTCDGGVVLDLSLMNGIRVDPDARTLRTEGGCTLREVSHAGGAYVNFMMDEDADRVQTTYRSNYDRLAAVKAKYDPANLFRVNWNIKPQGTAGAIRPAGKETSYHGKISH